MTKLFLLTLLLFSIPAHALIRFGLQGGLYSGNVSTDPVVDTTSASGLAAGALLELGLSEHMSLQPEILYVTKGYTQSAIGALVPETRVKVGYLEVPVFLKYQLDIPLLKPYFFAGPYFATKTSASYSDTAGGSGDLTTVKGTDFGLSGGAGAELSLGLMGLFASLRYDLGLSNTSDTAGVSAKNKGLMINAGLIFGI